MEADPEQGDRDRDSRLVSGGDSDRGVAHSPNGVLRNRDERNPYIAIMNHADRGIGLRLTPEETKQLAADSHIRIMATAALSPKDAARFAIPGGNGELMWRKVNMFYKAFRR